MARILSWSREYVKKVKSGPNSDSSACRSAAWVSTPRLFGSLEIQAALRRGAKIKRPFGGRGTSGRGPDSGEPVENIDQFLQAGLAFFAGLFDARRHALFDVRPQDGQTDAIEGGLGR
jgi:hypothetical protein